MTDTGDAAAATSQLPRSAWTWFWICLGAILGMAVLLRTQHLITASYWFDESSSWKTIQFGWEEMLVPIRRNVHPPVYYFLLKGWATLFSDGPLSLRLFSLCCGLLTILGSAWLTWIIVKPQSDTNPVQFRDLETVLFSAALISLSPLHVLLSLNARMYTLGTMLAILYAIQVFKIAQTGGTNWTWFLATVSGILLSLTHYFGLFTLAACGLFLGRALFQQWRESGWSAKTKRMFTRFAVASWCLLNVWGFWLPSFLSQRNQVGENYWIQPFSQHQFLRVCSGLVTSKFAPKVDEVWEWLPIGWGVSVVVLLLLQRNQGGGLLAYAAGIPFLLITLYSYFIRSLFVLRYLLFVQLFFLLGWSVLTHAISWNLPRIGVRACTLAWVGYWALHAYQHRNWECERSELKNVVQVLEEWRAAEELVLVATPVTYVTLLQYSHHAEGIYTVQTAHGFPHYQGAPLLRESEYYPVRSLQESDFNTVFTIDVQDLYGPDSEFAVRLPREWQVVRQRWFEERHHQSCRVFLREYQRSNQRSDQQRDSSQHP